MSKKNYQTKNKMCDQKENYVKTNEEEEAAKIFGFQEFHKCLCLFELRQMDYQFSYNKSAIKPKNIIVWHKQKIDKFIRKPLRSVSQSVSQTNLLQTRHII